MVFIKRRMTTKLEFKNGNNNVESFKQIAMRLNTCNINKAIFVTFYSERYDEESGDH